MKDGIILVAVKDPGGANNAIPVADELLKMGEKALVVANGRAISLIAETREDYLYMVASSAQRVMDYLQKPPRCLVTSVCSDGGVGRGLVSLLRGKCPTVALEDFWSGGLMRSWADPRYRPDFKIVNDEIGAMCVKKAWADYDHNRIVILSYPRLDQYAYLQKPGAMEKANAKIRKELRLDEEKPVVLFAGQVKNAGTELAKTVAALNQVGQEVYLLPRQHPRMKDDAPEEIPVWETSLADFQSGAIVDSSAFKKVEPLLPATTVVVSPFSTVSADAAAIGIQTISLRSERLRESSGGLLEVPPIVSLGCSVQADNHQELCALLEQAFAGELAFRFEKARKKAFCLNGNNARGVADFVLSL